MAERATRAIFASSASAAEEAAAQHRLRPLVGVQAPERRADRFKCCVRRRVLGRRGRAPRRSGSACPRSAVAASASWTASLRSGGDPTAHRAGRRGVVDGAQPSRRATRSPLRARRRSQARRSRADGRWPRMSHAAGSRCRTASARSAGDREHHVRPARCRGHRAATDRIERPGQRGEPARRATGS